MEHEQQAASPAAARGATEAEDGSLPAASAREREPDAGACFAATSGARRPEIAVVVVRAPPAPVVAPGVLRRQPRADVAHAGPQADVAQTRCLSWAQPLVRAVRSCVGRSSPAQQSKESGSSVSAASVDVTKFSATSLPLRSSELRQIGLTTALLCRLDGGGGSTVCVIDGHVAFVTPECVGVLDAIQYTVEEFEQVADCVGEFATSWRLSVEQAKLLKIQIELESREATAATARELLEMLEHAFGAEQRAPTSEPLSSVIAFPFCTLWRSSVHRCVRLPSRSHRWPRGTSHPPRDLAAHPFLRAPPAPGAPDGFRPACVGDVSRPEFDGHAYRYRDLERLRMLVRQYLVLHSQGEAGGASLRAFVESHAECEGVEVPLLQEVADEEAKNLLQWDANLVRFDRRERLRHPPPASRRTNSAWRNFVLGLQGLGVLFSTFILVFVRVKMHYLTRQLIFSFLSLVAAHVILQALLLSLTVYFELLHVLPFKTSYVFFRCVCVVLLLFLLSLAIAAGAVLLTQKKNLVSGKILRDQWTDIVHHRISLACDFARQYVCSAFESRCIPNPGSSSCFVCENVPVMSDRVWDPCYEKILKGTMLLSSLWAFFFLNALSLVCEVILLYFQFKKRR